MNMKFYKSLFVFFHRIAIFLGNEGFFPEALAYFFTVMLPWLNFLTIINIIELKTRNTYTNEGVILIL